MTEADEIAAWLRAQAQADIEVARKATPGPWEFEGDDPTDDELFTVHDGEHGDLVGDIVAFTRGYGQQVANGKHIERHDPLTEAARAESVLAVLDDRERTAAIARPAECPQGETASRDYLRALIELAVMDHVVRLLAHGYQHREGFKEAWRP